MLTVVFESETEFAGTLDRVHPDIGIPEHQQRSNATRSFTSSLLPCLATTHVARLAREAHVGLRARSNELSADQCLHRLT